MASFSSSSGFPAVGGQLVLEGVSAFNKAADSAIHKFDDINRASLKLSKSMAGSLGGPLNKATAYTRLDAGIVTGYLRFPGILQLVTAAAVGTGIAIVALGAKFAQTGRAVQVFGDTTEREMLNIQKQSVALSRAFTTPANDISKAAVSLGKAGAPIKELNNNIIKSAVVFEQAAQSELSAAEAGDLIVQTVTALGLKYSDSTKIVDTYVGAVNKSTLTYSELKDNLRQLLPVMGALNIDVTDGATALALLAESGLRGTIGGTALKNALIAIADPSKEAAKILKDYNITLFDAQGKTLPLIEIIGRLSDAFGDTAEGMTEAQKIFATTDIFSTRQILAAFSLIKQGPGAFAELKTAIQGVSSEQVAQDLQNNLISQIALIGNNVIAATYAITGRFEPAIARMAKTVAGALTGTSLQGFQDFGDSIDRIITLNDEFVNELLSKTAPAFVIIGQRAKQLGVDWTTIGQTILKVADIFSTVIIGIVTAFEKISEFGAKDVFPSGQFSRDFENLKNGLKSVGDFAIKVLKTVLNVVIDVATGIIAAFEAVKDAIGGVFAFIGKRFQLLGKMLSDPIASAKASFTGAFDIDSELAQLEEEGNNAFVNLGESYQKHFLTLRSGLLEFVGGQVSAVETIINTAATSIMNTGNAILEDFKGNVISEAASVRAIVQNMLSDLHSLLAAPTLSIADEIGILTAPSPNRPAVATPRIGGSTFPSGGGGTGGGKEDIDKIAARIRQMLHDLPAMNQELADFLAGITQDFPERLGGMVSTLLGARDAVGQLAIAKSEMLAVDLQLIDSAARLSDLEGQAGRLELEQARAVLGYDRQLLGLRHQLLEIDMQTWPIRDQITDIEREINKLSRENYELTRQRISLEIQMLPIRQQIEALDKRIAATQITDWAARRRALLLEQQALPFKRQIQAIEEKITAAVDKRANLLKRREEITAEAGVEGIRNQLTDTEQELAKAWSTMDVPRILELEKQKATLTSSLETAENNLRKIQIAQASVARATELTTINYELEKLAIEESLKPITDKLTALSETEEITRLLNEITNTYLEEEKQALALVMAALEDKLKAISDEVTLENLRNQLLISHLDEERQRLQDILIPYEDQRKALERIIAEVDLMRARTALEFEERAIGIQAMILDEKLRQAELAETQRKQNLLFQDLVLGFITSMEASGEFTAAEGSEVLQRLGLWSDQIAKLVETKLEFDRVKAAADAYSGSLKAIERNIEVVITTIHRERYENAAATATTTSEPEFARGGVVPGMPWERRRIIAHGGEIIINPNTQTRNRETMAAGYSRNITNNNNNTYSVAANYANQQSPASIGMDIRALIMMAQKG